MRTCWPSPRFAVSMVVVLLATTAGRHVIAQSDSKQSDTGKPAAPTPAETADRNLSAYAELLRSDLRAQKVAILTELMDFTEAEDTAFWPIYRQYEVELARINDDRIALIDQYATHYAKVTDTVADKLANQALALEARRTTLKQQYYERVKTALSARTAARFLQIEQQIQLLLDLQIAAALPIVK